MIVFDQRGNAALSYTPGDDTIAAYFAGELFFDGRLSEPTDLELRYGPRARPGNAFPYLPPAPTFETVSDFSHTWQNDEFRANYAFDAAAGFTGVSFEWEHVAIAMSIDRCVSSARQTISSDSGSVETRSTHYHFGCATSPIPAAECLVHCEP